MCDSVRCPECKLKHEDLWEIALEDGDMATIKCDCGHEFVIRCEITVDYVVIANEEAADE